MRQILEALVSNQDTLHGDQIRILNRLDSVQGSLNRIEHRLGTIEEREDEMSLDLTKLAAQAAANGTLIESVITILQAIPPSTDPTTQAAIDQIVSDLSSQDSALGAAIAAGTPAAGAPVDPVPTPPTT